MKRHFFKELKVENPNEVFPELPVIDINFAFEIFRTSLDASVKTFNALLVRTFFDLFNLPAIAAICSPAEQLETATAYFAPTYFDSLFDFPVFLETGSRNRLEN